MIAAKVQVGPPALSIVVETANTPPGDYAGLDATLAAFDRQTLSSELFELIVVFDPVLHPGLGQHLRNRAPKARIVEGPGAHYYGQKNLGARAAAGDIVAFMDSDCIPARGWAESILGAFSRSDDSMGAVQGTVWSDRSVLGYAFVLTNFGLHQAQRERKTTGLTGNNCAFRRAEFLSSPFDETPVFHGPDVRMAALIRKRGRYILLVPGAANHHHFLPGFRLFMAHGVYWGYCFLSLRRAKEADVPYAAFFRTLGGLAPVALVPAKMMLDLRRLYERRRDLRLTVAETIGTAAALIVNSAAVGWGGLRAVVGLPPPTSPTSSNAHMKTLSANVN